MYTPEQYAQMILKYKDSNPGLAYAIFNGASGMGGGMDTGFQAGAVDVALRNLMGPEAAKNWIGAGSNQYGNAMMDPKTGQYSFYQDGKIQQGSVEGYDPSQFNTQMKTGSVNYDPTQTASNQPGATGVGLNSAQWMRANPDGTYSGVQYGATPPGTPPPKPVGTGTAPRSTTGGRTVAGGPPSLGNNRGPSVGTGTGIPPPIGTGGGPPGTTTGNPRTTTGGGGMTPPGPNSNTGANGGLPVADPGTYDPMMRGSYTAPTRGAAATDPFNFEEDPGYQFRRQQGMEGIQNSAASRGNLGSGATLKALAQFNSGLASQEYDKAYGRYDTNRKYAEGQHEYDTGQARHGYEWDTGNDQEQDRDARDFNSGNYWKTLGFNETQRKDARDFDYRKSVGDRDYDTGLDQWNKEFGYKVSSGDRAFNAETLQALSRMGLSATSSQADLAKALAAIFGSNTMTGATAGAQGTTGQANNWMSLLNSILGYGQNSRNASTLEGIINNSTRKP